MLSFLPVIVTMFFFLSLMEDSGYIARVAFFMDKAMRKLGLSGRSIVPLLIGFGCSVPAVMSSRTLPSERDHRMTILLTPFMSCTAKLPIYAFFVDAFSLRKYRTMLAAHKRVNFSRLPPAKISITRQVTFDFCSSQSVSKKPDGMGLQGASEIPTDTAIMVEIGVAQSL